VAREEAAANRSIQRLAVELVDVHDQQQQGGDVVEIFSRVRSTLIGCERRGVTRGSMESIQSLTASFAGIKSTQVSRRLLRYGSSFDEVALERAGAPA